MTATAQDIYAESVRTLPPSERLRLAALILDELTHRHNVAHIDYGDAWTEQDRNDMTAFSLQHAASAYSEEEDLV